MVKDEIISKGMFTAAANAVAKMCDSSKEGASLLSLIEKIHDVSIYVAVEVAKAAINEGVARADMKDVAQAVVDAVWQPEYKEIKSVGNWVIV